MTISYHIEIEYTMTNSYHIEIEYTMQFVPYRNRIHYDQFVPYRNRIHYDQFVPYKNRLHYDQFVPYGSIYIMSISYHMEVDTLWQIRIIGKYITYNQTYGRNRDLVVPMCSYVVNNGTSVYFIILCVFIVFVIVS
jgi:hypothetical protein